MSTRTRLALSANRSFCLLALQKYTDLRLFHYCQNHWIGIYKDKDPVHVNKFKLLHGHLALLYYLEI